MLIGRPLPSNYISAHWFGGRPRSSWHSLSGKARPRRRPLCHTCNSKLQVVFVSTEVAPWSKTGGLGDVVASLPVALAARGHRVMTVAPRYADYPGVFDTGMLAPVELAAEAPGAEPEAPGQGQPAPGPHGPSMPVPVTPGPEAGATGATPGPHAPRPVSPHAVEATAGAAAPGGGAGAAGWEGGAARTEERTTAAAPLPSPEHSTRAGAVSGGGRLARPHPDLGSGSGDTSGAGGGGGAAAQAEAASLLEGRGEVVGAGPGGNAGAGGGCAPPETGAAGPPPAQPPPPPRQLRGREQEAACTRAPGVQPPVCPSLAADGSPHPPVPTRVDYVRLYACEERGVLRVFVDHPVFRTGSGAVGSGAGATGSGTPSPADPVMAAFNGRSQGHGSGSHGGSWLGSNPDPSMGVYTYSEGLGHADLQARNNVLCQAALAAPVLLWQRPGGGMPRELQDDLTDASDPAGPLPLPAQALPFVMHAGRAQPAIALEPGGTERLRAAMQLRAAARQAARERDRERERQRREAAASPAGAGEQQQQEQQPRRAAAGGEGTAIGESAAPSSAAADGAPLHLEPVGASADFSSSGDAVALPSAGEDRRHFTNRQPSLVARRPSLDPASRQHGELVFVGNDWPTALLPLWLEAYREGPAEAGAGAAANGVAVDGPESSGGAERDPVASNGSQPSIPANGANGPGPVAAAQVQAFVQGSTEGTASATAGGPASGRNGAADGAHSPHPGPHVQAVAAPLDGRVAGADIPMTTPPLPTVASAPSTSTSSCASSEPSSGRSSGVTCNGNSSVVGDVRRTSSSSNGASSSGYGKAASQDSGAIGRAVGDETGLSKPVPSGSWPDPWLAPREAAASPRSAGTIQDSGATVGSAGGPNGNDATDTAAVASDAGRAASAGAAAVPGASADAASQQQVAAEQAAQAALLQQLLRAVQGLGPAAVAAVAAVVKPQSPSAPSSVAALGDPARAGDAQQAALPVNPAPAAAEQAHPPGQPPGPYASQGQASAVAEEAATAGANGQSHAPAAAAAPDAAPAPPPPPASRPRPADPQRRLRSTLRSFRRFVAGRLGGARVVFTLHNPAFQGAFPEDTFPRLGLPPAAKQRMLLQSQGAETQEPLCGKVAGESGGAGDLDGAATAAGGSAGVGEEAAGRGARELEPAPLAAPALASAPAPDVAPAPDTAPAVSPASASAPASPQSIPAILGTSASQAPASATLRPLAMAQALSPDAAPASTSLASPAPAPASACPAEPSAVSPAPDPASVPLQAPQPSAPPAAAPASTRVAAPAPASAAPAPVSALASGPAPVLAVSPGPSPAPAVPPSPAPASAVVAAPAQASAVASALAPASAVASGTAAAPAVASAPASASAVASSSALGSAPSSVPPSASAVSPGPAPPPAVQPAAGPATNAPPGPAPAPAVAAAASPGPALSTPRDSMSAAASSTPAPPPAVTPAPAPGPSPVSTPAPATAPRGRLLSWLKAALTSSDRLVTVSPAFARQLADAAAASQVASEPAAQRPAGDANPQPPSLTELLVSSPPLPPAPAPASGAGTGGVGGVGLPAGPGGAELAVLLAARPPVGIMNGLDVAVWDPATDPLLPPHLRYDAAGAAGGKAAAKAALQAALGLDPDPDAVLFGFVGRLEAQKGADVLLAVLPELLGPPAPGFRGNRSLGCDAVAAARAAAQAAREAAALRALPARVAQALRLLRRGLFGPQPPGAPASSSPPLTATTDPLQTDAGTSFVPPVASAAAPVGRRRLQFVLLGSGAAWLQDGLAALPSAYPGSAAGLVGFSEAGCRRLLAGADFLLLPSRWEPCGLAALAARRYGAVPVVAPVAGLLDAVAATGPSPPPAAAAVMSGSGVTAAQKKSAEAAEEGSGPLGLVMDGPVGPTDDSAAKRAAIASLARAVRRAAELYGSDAYGDLRQRCMEADASWAGGPAAAWEALLREAAGAEVGDLEADTLNA